MEQRIVSGFERSLTTTVDNIEHVESQTEEGRSIIKVYFQPAAKIATAIAQITAISQYGDSQHAARNDPPAGYYLFRFDGADHAAGLAAEKDLASRN